MNKASYFNYLLQKINAPTSYRRLLELLFNEEFRWDFSIFSDANRADDGLGLRLAYLIDEKDYEDIHEEPEPCNVLEMLVALSIRIETDLMGEPGNDHPERWFWEMIDNLGLAGMTNAAFNEMYVINVIGNWMARNYKKNGEGSLFPLKRPRVDTRKEPIWDQMSDYLNEKY